MKSKIIKELEAGRVVGPFTSLPFETLQVSPLGLVPKKQPGEYRVIHHLSYPEGSRLAKRREILIFPRTAGNTGNSRELLVIPGNYWEIGYSPTRKL